MNACIVNLGAAGDICSSLSLAWWYAQQGHSVTMVSSEPYADIPKGTTYCGSLALGLHYSQPREALKIVQAMNIYDKIIACQMYGMNQPRQTDCFQKDAYRVAGHLDQFGIHPLVFDRRDEERENRLIEIMPQDKPWILINTHGKSSPFAHSDLVLRHVIQQFGKDFNIIDLQHIKAARFYDLLGLYDLAHCLISSDTGTAHLARASNVPLVLFRTDKPDKWHAMHPPENTIFQCYYSEVPRRLSVMDHAISSILNHA